MTLNMMEKIKHIIRENKSMILVIPLKSSSVFGCTRFSAKIHAYSKIANIIIHCTPVIHSSMLLNPLLEGAFVDP